MLGRREILNYGRLNHPQAFKQIVQDRDEGLLYRLYFSLGANAVERHKAVVDFFKKAQPKRAPPPMAPRPATILTADVRIRRHIDDYTRAILHAFAASPVKPAPSENEVRVLVGFFLDQTDLKKSGDDPSPRTGKVNMRIDEIERIERVKFKTPPPARQGRDWTLVWEALKISAAERLSETLKRAGSIEGALDTFSDRAMLALAVLTKREEPGSFPFPPS